MVETEHGRDETKTKVSWAPSRPARTAARHSTTQSHVVNKISPESGVHLWAWDNYEIIYHPASASSSDAEAAHNDALIQATSESLARILLITRSILSQLSPFQASD